MKKRKFFVVLMSLIMVLTFMPSIVFADAGSGHDWKKTDTKEYKNFNVEVYECQTDGCTAAYSVVVAKPTHQHEFTQNKAALTEEELAKFSKADNKTYIGGYAYKCACGELADVELIEADPVPVCEHKNLGERQLLNWACYNEDANSGVKVYGRICADCNEVILETEVGEGFIHTGLPAEVASTAENAVAVGDKFYAGTLVVAPTCTTEGKLEVRCSDCKVLLGEAVVPALGHDFKNAKEVVVTPATCEEDGTKAHICNTCGVAGEIYAGDKALGHDYDIVDVAAPTIWAEGVTVAQCNNCDEFEVIDAVKDGDKFYFTGFNGELTGDKRIEVRNDAQLEAKWSKDWTEKLADATCETGAIMAKIDSVSGSLDVHNTREVGEPLGHKEVTVTVEPTCTDDGYSYIECEACGLFKDNKHDRWHTKLDDRCFFDKKPALGGAHDYTWEVTEEATIFGAGSKAYKCTKCGHVEKTEVIAKKAYKAPKVTAVKKAVKVTVAKQTGAVKYKIYVNGKLKKTVKKAKTYKIKAKAGKAKVKIVAFNSAGQKATSKVKTVTVKK